ncbi:MAG TPA: response regulator [Acidobacteriota bacterium]|nr:response regulator [Acidobacteriota bacterium]
MHVLIVEDDPLSAQLLQIVLKTNGYQTTVAADGLAALNLIEQSRFDLLLVDWMMPEMDGIELIRQVRSKVSPCPPIILLSALETGPAQAYALQVGATSFIAKPFQPQAILSGIKSALSAPAPSPARVSFSKADLKILIVEDDVLSAKLLEKILTDAGYSTTICTNGLDALNLYKEIGFDVLIVDWMMPKMDGIELTRQVRSKPTANPTILFMTALGSDESCRYALEAGANQFLAKPISPSQLLASLEGVQPARLATHHSPATYVQPSFAGVCIGAGTNGSLKICELFRRIPPTLPAAFFITLYGPAWVTRDFASRLQRDTPLPVRMVEDGEGANPGKIYVTPGGRHLRIEPGTLRMRLQNAPFPADPFFRSTALAFGRCCLAVIMNSLEVDHSLGLTDVVTAGGQILKQAVESPPMLGSVASRAPLTTEVKPRQKIVLPENLDSTITYTVTQLMPLGASRRA